MNATEMLPESRKLSSKVQASSAIFTMGFEQFFLLVAFLRIGGKFNGGFNGFFFIF
jgi:hypothetical protein